MPWALGEGPGWVPFKGWVKGEEGASEKLIPNQRVSDTNWDFKRAVLARFPEARSGAPPERGPSQLETEGGSDKGPRESHSLPLTPLPASPGAPWEPP